jgi:cytochrome c oxidase cbb3-type subunit 3/ubiquinol-cytochrome c reductase cytochrome c subunit
VTRRAVLGKRFRIVETSLDAARKSACATLVALTVVLLLASCEPPGKPKLENTPAEITDFKTLFSENCSGCHGENGRYGAGRPLNDPLYLAVIPKDTLRNVIENGRPGTAMPPWARNQGGPLYPKQITALVDGIEQTWAKPVHLTNVAVPSYAGNTAGDPVHGKKLFARDCFMCHGKGAPIGSVTDPAVLALVSDQYLRTSILFGRLDFGMPNFRNLNMGRALSDQDVTDLVAYLSSMRPPSVQTAQAEK